MYLIGGDKVKAKKISIVLLACLLVGGTGTYAATKSKTVQATVSSFKYALNGANWNPKTTTSPVVINGQTYIPVSLAKEATKTNISVDAKSGKMNFGEKLAETTLDKEKISYGYGNYAALSKDTKYTQATEVPYKEVIVGKNLAKVTFYPDNRYQTMVLDLKAFDGSAKVSVIDEDTKEELKALFLNIDSPVEELDFSVVGRKTIVVKFEADNYSKGTNVAIFPSSYYK